MRSTRRFLLLAGSLALTGLLMAGPQEARAQIPVYSTEGVFAPVGPVMTRRTYVVPPGSAAVPAPVVTSSQAYVVPGRQVYRTERRYFARRPSYGGRPQLSFGPYSDSYPKTAPPQAVLYPDAPR